MQRRSRHAVLALCLAAYFAIRFAQLVISPVVPAIMDAFAVSRGAVGVALTGMWAAYALAQLPSGVFGDRYGERRVVLAALGIAGLGSTVVAAAPTYAVFVGVVALLGVGAGLYYNAATALLARLYEAVGRAVGSHRTGGQVAGLLAPTVAVTVVPYGWRAAPLVGGAVALVAAIAFAVGVRATAPANPTSSLRAAVSAEVVGGLLSRPAIALPTAVAIVGEFALIATTSFLPTFLVEHHGLSLAVAVALFTGYFATVAVAQPVSGWLSDRVGRDPVLGLALLAGVVGYAALALGRTAITAVPAVAAVGFAMSWAAPLQSRVMDALPPAERGVGFGLVRTIYILVGSLGSAVVGGVADAAGWSAAFGVLVGLLLIGLGLIGANRVLGAAV